MSINDSNPDEVPGQTEAKYDDNPDLLPEQSPQTLHKRGVRRINNVPLLIVLGAAALFIGVMSYTVISRDSRRIKTSIRRVSDSASSFAAEIIKSHAPINNKHSAVQKAAAKLASPPVNATTSSTSAPEVPKPHTPVVVHNPELDRIKQRKLQLIEQAINSDPRIRFNPVTATQTTTSSRQAAIRSEIERVQRELNSIQNGGNPNALTQAGQQLTQLQVENSGDTGSEIYRLDRGTTGTVASLQVPRTKYLLRTGSFIPAMLLSGINSDLPGQIIAQVSQNVYDSPSGNHLLIPQGSRLIGEYSSKVKYGQSRIFAVWQRIVFPDGKAMDLGAFPAATGAGYSGMKDKVDNHYIRIFSSAIMLSGIIAGVEYSQNQTSGETIGGTERMGDTMSSALGQTLGQTMIEILRKNMSIAPTLKIRPGFRMNVMLVKDLEFANSYRAFDWRK